MWTSYPLSSPPATHRSKWSSQRDPCLSRCGKEPQNTCTKRHLRISSLPRRAVFGGRSLGPLIRGSGVAGNIYGSSARGDRRPLTPGLGSAGATFPWPSRHQTRPHAGWLKFLRATTVGWSAHQCARASPDAGTPKSQNSFAYRQLALALSPATWNELPATYTADRSNIGKRSTRDRFRERVTAVRNDPLERRSAPTVRSRKAEDEPHQRADPQHGRRTDIERPPPSDG